MSRWHRESCSAPVIVVEQQIPICKSCNATPDLKKIISEKSGERLSPSSIPPDKPRGKLNLWWPPCVPYASSSCSETLPDNPVGGHHTRWPLRLLGGFKSPLSLLSRPLLSSFLGIGFELQSAPARVLVDESVDTYSSQHHNFRNPVYPSQLEYHELRLIRLTPVEDVDAPVHVDLELHHRERYPEYETVSYTWGGEVCDSTLCRPVYVGTWDVLIQTRNCWEMLRYIRPRRDVRTIWVDAICINQYDFQERETHVGNMGRIYENAIRTVVYLGPDLVSPTSASSPYPWRHYLQSLDYLQETYDPVLPETRFQCTKRVTLADLLEREYFQRVWVIQELLLSRAVVLGIGNMEFAIDRQWGHISDSKPRPAMSLKSDRVPWFEHTTQGSIFDRGKDDIFFAVDLASESKSTDPRDQVFGVLGMIRQTYLTPSYSISFQHLAIGYFAYCLTIQKELRVIGHAAGLQASADMPSWAPPPNRLGTKAPAIPRLGVDKRLSMLDSNGFFTAYERHHSSKNLDLALPTPEALGHGCRTDFERWKANDYCQTCWKVTGDWLSKSKLLGAAIDINFQIRHEDKSVDPSRDWHSQVKVDTLTGALLSLTALQFLCFGQSGLCLTETYRDEGVYTYVFRNGTSSLLVRSQDACFELPTYLSETYLFALGETLVNGIAPGGPFKARLCILRSIDKDKFQLVSANVDICFHTFNFPTESYDLSGHPMWEKVYIKAFGPRYMQLAHNKVLLTAIPMIRREAVNQILDTDDWPIWNKEPERRRRCKSLPLKDLYGDLSYVKRELRRTWVSQNHCSQDFLRFLNFDNRFSPPHWISFAFAGVTNPRDYLHILHAASLVEADTEGSINAFLRLYLHLVDDLSPQVFEARPPASFDSQASADPETFVELSFKPHQFPVLSDVLQLVDEVHCKSAETWPGQSQIVEPNVFMVHAGDMTIHQQYLDSGSFAFVDAQSRWEVFHSVLGELFGSTLSSIKERIQEHEGETIRILFDLKMLMTWAQLHPCAKAFRALRPFCQDGENELTLLLRDPLPEDADIIVPWWPHIIGDGFGINKLARLRRITVI